MLHPSFTYLKSSEFQLYTEKKIAIICRTEYLHFLHILWFSSLLLSEILYMPFPLFCYRHIFIFLHGCDVFLPLFSVVPEPCFKSRKTKYFYRFYFSLI